MDKYIHIIVERLPNNWSAWFKDSPAFAVGEKNPGDAIQRLISISGYPVDRRCLHVVSGSLEAGRMELRTCKSIQVRGGIPTTSSN